MAFDLDDEELEATKRLNGVAKDKIEGDIKIKKTDIDILNALINVYESKLPDYDKLMPSEVEVLKRVLAEREEDKKKIKKLEEENKKNVERYEERDNEVWERVKQCKNMQTEIDGLYLDKEELKQAYLHEKLAKEEVEELLENSIPTQKIIDKIKEIQKEEDLYAKNNMIKILKELLEDK